MSSEQTWEEATTSRLQEARAQLQQADRAFKFWDSYVRSLQEVLELDKQLRGIKINGQHVVDPEKLRQKSVRQSLIEIGTRNNGVLVATEAVSILVEAGVFSTKKDARPAVYSVLGRSKRDFRKERPGLYQVISTQPVPLDFGH